MKEWSGVYHCPVLSMARDNLVGLGIAMDDVVGFSWSE